MKELSLNILDIAMNSVKAGASLVGIYIDETDDELRFSITDDGCGMSEEQVKKLSDPFYTTRTTRKVGLGVPFLKLAAEQSGGSVEIKSREQSLFPDNHGTTVTASFDKTNIDFTPLGDVSATLLTLIQGYPDIDFEFKHVKNNREAELSTREIKQALGNEIPVNSLEILGWIKDNLLEQYKNINE